MQLGGLKVAFRIRRAATVSDKLRQTPTVSDKLPQAPTSSDKLPWAPTSSDKPPQALRQTPTGSDKFAQPPTSSDKLRPTPAGSRKFPHAPTSPSPDKLPDDKLQGARFHAPVLPSIGKTAYLGQKPGLYAPRIPLCQELPGLAGKAAFKREESSSNPL